MEVRAYLKYARTSPHRVSIVLGLIRDKETDPAIAILKHILKAVCEDLQKLLRPVTASVENNHDMDVTRLYVAECFVSPGPIFEHIRPRTWGCAFRILKRTPYVTLVLKEKE